MNLLRSSILAACFVTAAQAGDNAPNLDDWSDIVTTLRCAAVGKVSKQPDHKIFEMLGLETLRGFFTSADDSLLVEVQHSLLLLDQVGLDDSVDFKVGIAFSVLYRETLGAIEIRIDPNERVVPDFPDLEQQEVARELYAMIDCEALLP